VVDLILSDGSSNAVVGTKLGALAANRGRAIAGEVSGQRFACKIILGKNGERNWEERRGIQVSNSSKDNYIR
jgi:hypothetical protein